MNVWKRVVAAALLDFAAYQILHTEGPTPVAALLQEWANERGIPLDDPATDWQEILG